MYIPNHVVQRTMLTFFEKIDITRQYGPPPGHGAVPAYYRPDGSTSNAPRSRPNNERTRTLPQINSGWGSTNNRIIHQLPLTDEFEEEVDEQDTPPTTMLEIDPSEEPRIVHRSNTF